MPIDNLTQITDEMRTELLAVVTRMWVFSNQTVMPTAALNNNKVEIVAELAPAVNVQQAVSAITELAEANFVGMFVNKVRAICTLVADGESTGDPMTLEFTLTTEQQQ